MAPSIRCGCFATPNPSPPRTARCKHPRRSGLPRNREIPSRSTSPSTRVTRSTASGSIAWLTEVRTYGSVLLHKYVCPDGTNTAGLRSGPAVARLPRTAKLPISSFVAGAATGNETDANGYLGFINFSPGSYLLREIEPLGYVPARIFCRRITPTTGITSSIPGSSSPLRTRPGSPSSSRPIGKPNAPGSTSRG